MRSRSDAKSSLPCPQKQRQRSTEPKERDQNVELPHPAHCDPTRLDRHEHDGRNHSRKKIKSESSARSIRVEISHRARRLRPEENVASLYRFLDHRHARQQKSNDSQGEIRSLESAIPRGQKVPPSVECCRSAILLYSTLPPPDEAVFGIDNFAEMRETAFRQYSR